MTEAVPAVLGFVTGAAAEAEAASDAEVCPPQTRAHTHTHTYIRALSAPPLCHPGARVCCPPRRPHLLSLLCVIAVRRVG